jgi:hypothetical protein
MITVSSLSDLQKFGIEVLTGESCGLGMRLLCDVSSQGKRLIEKCLGVESIKLYENWNTRSAIGEHVGSIMLSREMFVPLAVFGLLEYGCTEVYVPFGDDRYVYGVLRDDPPDEVEHWKQLTLGWHKSGMRRYAYAGTAGMTGYRYSLPAELRFTVIAETPEQANALAEEFVAYLCGDGIDVESNGDYQEHHEMVVYPDDVANKLRREEEWPVASHKTPTQMLRDLGLEQV